MIQSNKILILFTVYVIEKMIKQICIEINYESVKYEKIKEMKNYINFGANSTLAPVRYFPSIQAQVALQNASDLLSFIEILFSSIQQQSKSSMSLCTGAVQQDNIITTRLVLVCFQNY
ncbi:Hypothetical_protein [Hexamita inflata]|uniref:Hypothetical_protein n=1 Tax=Hexamita inflata TaxID=28002 RepID=A0AA86RCQ0_9EUKA|nr:Hypothetical protein HINF_LOCUS63141 [Hexamita inflata]